MKYAKISQQEAQTIMNKLGAMPYVQVAELISFFSQLKYVEEVEEDKESE